MVTRVPNTFELQNYLKVDNCQCKRYCNLAYKLSTFIFHFSITDGATLQLVLAMRGGPINTRRSE